MPRLQRSQLQSGWFHVMNRGVDRQDIVESDLDRRIFLDELGDAAGRTAVEVHAFCVMSTHYHLVLHCPSGGLSDFVQLVTRNYAGGFNRRMEREGPVFTGRFVSTELAVDSDEPETSLKLAVRYVHRNPLDFLPLAALRSYAYSSYPSYLGSVRPPGWLHLDLVAGLHDLDVERFRTFTERSLPSDRTPANGREVPTWCPEAVIDAVATAAGVIPPEVLEWRPGTRNERRLVAAHLCVSLRTGSVAELAVIFGLTTHQGMRQLAARGKKLISVDPVYERLGRRALERLWAPAGTG